MRQAIVIGAALGIVMLSGTSAGAAAPEISQKNCDAAGGVFARDHGVKSCTTTSVGTMTTEHAGPRESKRWGPWVGGLTVEYTGTVRETDRVQTTTTNSQKGNGDVTTTTSTDFLAFVSYEWLSCHVEADYLGIATSRNVDPDVCANPQNYPPDSLFV